MRILFLCTGNVCRSPFAEHLVRVWADGTGGVESISAGVGALPGRPCPPPAIETAARFGVDLGSHRSRVLTAAMARQADIIVYMSDEHLDALAQIAPSVETRALCLADFAPGPVRPAEIPDPYGCEPWAYRACYTLMAVCLERMCRACLPTIPQRLEPLGLPSD